MPCEDKDKPALIRKALQLEYTLIAYNVVEAVISILAGVGADSIALVGFGLDSVIEIVAAGTLVWRLKGQGAADEHRMEKKALGIVGWTFFLLAAYLAYQSVSTLWLREPPRESLLGILIASLSLFVMPSLGWAKKRVAIQLGSRALEADAMETLICATLSAVLLIGLALNALWGWWWADPSAGLIMAVFIFKEGWEFVEESMEE